MINLEQGSSSIDRSHRGFQVTNPGWAVDPCRRGTEDSVVSRNCWLGGRTNTKKSRYLDTFWDGGLCECVCFWYLSMLCETCVYIYIYPNSLHFAYCVFSYSINTVCLFIHIYISKCIPPLMWQYLFHLYMDVCAWHIAIDQVCTVHPLSSFTFTFNVSEM